MKQNIQGGEGQKVLYSQVGSQEFLIEGLFLIILLLMVINPSNNSAQSIEVPMSHPRISLEC